MLVYFLEAPTQTHPCGYPGLGSTFVAHLAFHHLLLLGYDIHVHVQVAVWGWLCRSDLESFPVVWLQRKIYNNGVRVPGWWVGVYWY